MTFVHRIKDSKPKIFIHNCKRFYSHLTTPQCINQTSSLQRLLLPNHNFVTNPINFQQIYKCPDDFLFIKVRFFAAPAQYKKKEEEEVKLNRPRMNEEITAQFLRLVTDEGHSVVSLSKALDRAKSLDLDLVEVDADAKPPVCKIYDYNLEKYRQQIREKERAKSKGDGLKKSEPKEVRISAKTELKDLKMKADTAKRLMERGYRVKCIANGSQDQELLCGLLSQLLAMVEDIAFVDSGPQMDSKQAHLLMRHIKFSAGKKGKKASKGKSAAVTDAVEESNEEADSNNTDDVVTPPYPATPVSSMDCVDNDVKGPTSSHDERMQSETGTTTSTEVNKNRYAKSAANSTSAERNPMRFPSTFSHPPPPPPRPQPQSQPQPRYGVPPINMPRRQDRQMPNSGELRPQSINFGKFSNPNSNNSDAKRTPVPNNLNSSSSKSDGPQNPPSSDKKFGIFSR